MKMYRLYMRFYTKFYLYSACAHFALAPIIDIKIMIEVEPAEMNGSGNPVGGTSPLNTSYCIIKINQEKRANL